MLSCVGTLQIFTCLSTFPLHSLLGMLIHSFHIFAWPGGLLNSSNKWIRNFVWVVYINKRKVVKVIGHLYSKLEPSYILDRLTIIFASSIWLGNRCSLNMVLENSTWQIRNVNFVNFWTAPWLSRLIIYLNIGLSAHLHASFEARVNAFIISRR